MQHPSFLDRHLLRILDLQGASERPLDLVLRKYFKSHKELGSHDRRHLGETLFGMVRLKGLIDFLSPPHASSTAKIACYRSLSSEVLQDRSLPPAIRLGLSDFLYRRLKECYGEEETERLAEIFQSPAPITVRVNELKISRDALFTRWKEMHHPSLCRESKVGIQFSTRYPLFSWPEFKEGLFEVQDEGSQLIAQLIAIGPKESFLDYCSGSGGKSLAIAPSMRGTGQIYLHDIRPHVLQEAKVRFRRAGVQNVQFLSPGHPRLASLRHKIDWVLVDVPCSGTGTLRRNPDMKWKIDAASVERLQHTQRAIMQEALPYLRPGAQIVYATCSILPEENQSQVDYFLQKFPLSLQEAPLSFLPQKGGKDGFFAARFEYIG